ncbi:MULTISPECIES: site-specific integrase [unclassified Janthinobacterium]|uniref:site-specific integrase n=1 Tax=unclassified Janthinobacterium TaxID=2610881 RepID=UPI0003448B01|nr:MULTISPECIES: tyrosine-type recombinase/integrase [unclassified Janthinobacterium]MEC5161377.1 integrase [Janthinobacterium sp. CG_S6]
MPSKYPPPVSTTSLNVPVNTAALPVDAESAARHRALLAAATSDNTRRAYRSAVRHFQRWGGALPSDEASLIRYLLACAGELNARTIALRLTALSQWHVQQGFADPASTPTVRKTLAGIRRVHGKPKQKAKALPLEDLELIVAQLAGLDTLKAKRDSALLQIAYFGGFRRSEIVSLDVSHLAWEREGLVITLPRSKTDQQGEGIVKAIPFGDGACCPARALRVWLAAAGIASGPLFRPLNQWGHLGERALGEGSVNAILEAGATLALLDYVPQLSSHSLRRGMATSAHRAGASFRDIKRQGGWRHDGTVHGYIEEAAQFEENAALSLLRRRPVKVG